MSTVTVNTTKNTLTIGQGASQTNVTSPRHEIVLGSPASSGGGLSAYAMAQLNGLGAGVTEPEFYAALANTVETPVGRYTHTQPSAADVWTVNHNLGFRPDIKVFSAGGVEVMAEVIHITDNQAQITFDIAFAGTAVCE